MTAATLAAGKAFAQATPAAGRTAVNDHPAAARFQPATARRRPTSPIPTSSRSIRRSTRSRQPNSAIQRLWTGALWAEGPAWNAQGRYLVWSDIPNNRQLRWIEDDGRVSVFRIAVEQQQRQHLRLPGPAALLRAPDAPRRALRARRLGRPCWPTPTTASSSTRPTTSCPIPTAATGSPIRRTAASSTKARPTPPAARAMPPASSIRGSASRRASARCKRELPTNCYRIDPSGRVDLVRHRGPGARPQRPLLLARLQEALRRQHRQGTGRHRARRQGRHLRLRRRRRQQAVQRQALLRLHGRRRQVRARRHPLPTSTAISGSRATPAAPSATAASRCGPRRAS